MDPLQNPENIVSEEQLPPAEASVSEVNSQLQHGIQSCRSVVANYRNLLSGQNEGSNDNEPDENLSGIDER